PVATLVRLERDEEEALGQLVAERLNEAIGPVHVVAPTKGFSLADVEGGDLWDPEADRAFLDALQDSLRPDIEWFQQRSDIVLIPIGSCEQHGAHLPLGTDTITALEVSRRAALKADVPYTAPLWIGY